MAGVGAEARGRARELRRRLAADVAAFDAQLAAVPTEVTAGIAFKGARGQARAWARLLAALPEPYKLDRLGRVAIWRVLRPVGKLLGTDDALIGDEFVMVVSVAMGKVGRLSGRDEAPWGVQFGNHALARLCERSGFTACPQAAMIEAHDLLLGASATVADAMQTEGEWAIPAGPGAFLGTLRRTTEGPAHAVSFTADTWVASDQLRPEQAAQVASVRWREDGPTLGEGLLRPVALKV